jgi:hypothetical protein
VTGQRSQSVDMDRVIKLAKVAAKSRALYQDDLAARDRAIWEYDSVHGDGSIRRIAAATREAATDDVPCGMSPSEVHRVVTKETARRQADRERLLG